MKKVERAELLGLGEYEGIRAHFRGRMIETKKRRRVGVGPHMTLVFENHDTVLLQIQEMLRTERITAEKAIAHEVQTYNELVPEEGELSATLMIEYDDPAERTAALDALADVGDHMAIAIGDERYPARFRPLPGEEEGRLPAVNYLSFKPGRAAAQGLREGSARLVVTHPAYRHEAELSGAMRTELADDLDA